MQRNPRNVGLVVALGGLVIAAFAGLASYAASQSSLEVVPAVAPAAACSATASMDASLVDEWSGPLAMSNWEALASEDLLSGTRTSLTCTSGGPGCICAGICRLCPNGLGGWPTYGGCDCC